MMKRIRLFLIFWLCMAASIFAALRMLHAIAFNPQRAWLLAVAHDQLANTAANGDEDETISSRAGKAAQSGRRWGCILCRMLDWFDPGHCARNIEPDEGSTK